jgi:hypothetical protein
LIRLAVERHCYHENTKAETPKKMGQEKRASSLEARDSCFPDFVFRDENLARCLMAEATAGGFEYRGRAYRFQTATSKLDSTGRLYLEAEGDRCGLRLVGVPFADVSKVADLPGKKWEPNADELSIHADVFAEGGLRVRDKDLWIMAGRISCTRYDAEQETLGVSFRLDVQDEAHGREDEAAGVAYCQVES